MQLQDGIFRNYVISYANGKNNQIENPEYYRI